MAFSDSPSAFVPEPTRSLAPLLGVLCASGLAFLTVFGSRLAPTRQDEEPPQLQLEEPAQKRWQELRLAVAARPVERYSERLPGRVVVDDRRAARVSSPLAGRVERVHVELGQRVQRGDALLTISSLELPTLRSALAQADLELQLAAAEDARVQSMAKKLLLPAKEALSSAARLRRAELAQRTATARLRTLRLHGEREHSFVLTAAMSGTIVDKRVLGSQAVTPGETLLQIADLDAGVFVIADVFESDLGSIAAGAPARIHSRIAGEDVLETTVDMVAGVIDPVRHTLQVRMHVRGSRLRIHERVEVSILRAAPEGATEVSSAAVLSNGDQHRVYVQDDAGSFQRRLVQPGWRDAGRTVILAGLRPGERVVESGSHLLDSQHTGRF